MLRALLFSSLAAAHACAPARVVLENGAPAERDAATFAAAFAPRAGVFSRRIRTGITSDGYSEVLTVPSNDTASWRMAISDGAAEFYAIGPQLPTAKIPPGRYAVTIDVIMGGVTPVLYLDGPARWDACVLEDVKVRKLK